MSMDVDALLRAQVEMQSRITRAHDNLRKLGAAKITRGTVESRIQLIDSYWHKYMQTDELLRAKHWSSIERHEYITTDLTASVEDVYVQVRGAFSDLLRSLTPSPSADTSATAAVERSAQRASLPRINLPAFSGRYEDWPSFRDLFASIVGRDQSLSAVERLHYLKTSVKGEADQLIRCLPTTAENFQRAWSTLSDHYENRRLLVNSYCSAFLALPRMKNESAADLRRVYHGMTAAVGSLEGVGRPVFSNLDLFIHVVVSLFDTRTRREWELAVGGTSEPPSYETLRQFLETRIQVLAAMAPIKRENSETGRSEASARPVRAHHVQGQARSGRCSLCSGNHFLLFCDAYKRRSPSERRRHVESSALCLNCLGRHSLTECKSTKACVTCDRRHHSTLHETCAESASEMTTTGVAAHVVRRPCAAPPGVLLATARVLVRDGAGTLRAARALVDPAAEVSLVAESLVQRLRVPRRRASVDVYGVGRSAPHSARGSAEIAVVSRLGGDPIMVNALILPQVTIYGRGADSAAAAWPHLRDLTLADPSFRAGDAVELLLGAEVYPSILRSGMRRAGPRAPVAQETSLGWIITGMDGRDAPPPAPSVHVCSVGSELLSQVRAFWEQEELPPSPRPLTEELRCEDFFRLSVQRGADGRYTVRIPVKSELPDFSESHRAASSSLRSMVHRFKADGELRRMYVDFMSEYAALGHMVPTPPPRGPHRDACYLPHHGVLKASASSKKLRVVFNGSARLPSGDTLNQHLLVGANLVPCLADVLLRWRRHRFAFAADIEKMYRQVRVHPDDWRLQRVLWRASEGAGVEDYSLTTVTYGLSCAPYLAVRTLRQLADDEEKAFPEAASALREDAYVDDILSGADSEERAVELRDQLTRLCQAGGFPLRKWAANSCSLLAGVPRPQLAVLDAVMWEELGSHSTLGLQWCPREDSFAYRIRDLAEGPITRRAVLSRTAGLFDPLGWLAPVIVRAKIFVQHTWLLQLDWDDPLLGSEAEEWRLFERALPLLRDVRVPRWLGSTAGGARRVEVHGFADASERAYAAVVYLRTTSGDGSTALSLLAAKTRVAPLKQVSLPRLELCAAMMLARLVSRLRGLLSLESATAHLWSDSTVALGWIRGHPARWTTFVANRVAEIQRLLPEGRWRHVGSERNPADCASRGVSPAELLRHPLWWTGPDFLTMGEELTGGPGESINEAELPEQRRTAHVASAKPHENELLARFSSWHKLLRVTSWMLRWRCDSETRPGGPLTVEELHRAQTRWVTLEQGVAYPGELAAARTGNPVPVSSSLLPLSPYLDEAGVLRVGGRLRHAAIDEDARHPIILPPGSRLTDLVVDASHRRVRHGGVQLTLAIIRQQFWIPRGRFVVRHAIHRCPTCARWRAATLQPFMGELPQSRVTPSRPFTCTGVDYAGPVHVRTSKGRGHKAHKAFICVFVCLATRAVHLELVSDYTAEAFLAAYRRFISRRGPCRELRSDCGTNFVGADAQLRALFRAAGQESRQIADRLSGDGVRWRFNPPAAPHFGGIWEAAVKAVKHHLRRVVGETTLTFEEMSTFLSEVEACLNSRPLQALTDDPNDLEALTPGHFLIGAPLVSLPEPMLDEVPIGRLTRWRMLQQMRDHFWQRWSAEYLTALLPRPKWRKQVQGVRVGQLCLVRSQLTPPSRWPLARVTAVHPGADGHVRVVTVRTGSGEFTRPVVQIVPLLGVEECAATLPPADPVNQSAAGGGVQ